MRKKRSTIQDINTMRNVRKNMSSPGDTKGNKKSVYLELFILENKKQRVEKKKNRYQTQLNRVNKELRTLKQQEKNLKAQANNIEENNKSVNKNESEEVCLEY